MMGGTSELYQSVILDHNRAPRNYRAMDGADRHADGRNPLCGDHLTVWLKLDEGGERVADVSFQGNGCAISKASASLMTQAVKGKTVAESRALFERFHRLVTGTGDPSLVDELGKLAVFSGVAQFPVRVKCASLPWHTFKAALDQQPPEAPVSTE